MKKSSRFLAWFLSLSLALGMLPAVSDEVTADALPIAEEPSAGIVEAVEEPLPVEEKIEELEEIGEIETPQETLAEAPDAPVDELPDEPPAVEPAEDIAEAQPLADDAALSVLTLLPLKNIEVGDAFTVEYVYTGAAELRYGWQTLDETLVTGDMTEEDIALLWTEVSTEATLTVDTYAPDTAYRCVVTDGALTAVSTTAHVVAPEEDAEQSAEEAAEGGETTEVEEAAQTEEPETLLDMLINAEEPVEEEAEAAEAANESVEEVEEVVETEEQPAALLSLLIEGDQVIQGEETAEDEEIVEEELSEDELTVEGEEAVEGEEIVEVEEIAEEEMLLGENVEDDYTITVYQGKAFTITLDELKALGFTVNKITDVKYAISTADKSIATVKSGKVTGGKVGGRTTLTISKGEQKVEVPVYNYVLKVYTRLYGDEDLREITAFTIDANDTQEFELIASCMADDSISALPCSFTSSADGIASLIPSDDMAIVTPHAAGTATITISAGLLTKTVKVTVKTAVDHIVVKPVGGVALFENDTATKTITYVLKDANDKATDSQNIWLDSDGIHTDNCYNATLNLSKKSITIKANKASTRDEDDVLTIKAGDVLQKIPVVIFDRIKLSIPGSPDIDAPTAFTINRNESPRLFIAANQDKYTVDYSPSSDKIATVDKDGFVTFLKSSGSVTINVKVTKGDLTLTKAVKFTVKPTVTSITLKPASGKVAIFADDANAKTRVKTITYAFNKGADTHNVWLEGGESECYTATLNVSKKTVTIEALNNGNCDDELTLHAGDQTAKLTVAIIEKADAVTFYDDNEITEEITLSAGMSLPIICKTAPGWDEDLKATAFASAVSSDKKTATATLKNGVLTVKGVKAGTADITVKGYNGAEGILHVTVKPAAAKVEIGKTVLGLYMETDKPQSLDMMEVLAPVAKDKEGNPVPSTWTFSSSATKVVTVDKNTGVLTLLQTGTAKITVKSYNGKSAVCNVTVYARNPSAFTVKAPPYALAIKDSYTVPVVCDKEGAGLLLDWSCEPADGLSVSAAGVIKAVKNGTYVVTATPVTEELGFEPQSFTVRVLPKTQKVTVDDVCVAPGATAAVHYRLWDAQGNEAGGKVSLKSANTKVAAVDNTDIAVKGVACGNTTVTVTSGGKSARAAVIVKDPEAIWWIADDEGKAPESLRLLAGSRCDAPLRSDVPCLFDVVSSDSGVVTYEDGVLTTHASGTATLTATYTGIETRTAVLSVTVLDTPSYVRFADDAGSALTAVDMIPGDTLHLNTVTDVAECSFDYSIPDTGVIAFDEKTGTLTALAEGTAVLGVAAQGGPTASLAVNVVMPTEVHFEKDDGTPVSALSLVSGDALSVHAVADALTRFNYSISDDDVIRYEDGVLTAVHGGTATLSVVTAAGGLTADLTIGVAAPSRIGFTDEDGEALTAPVTLLLSDSRMIGIDTDVETQRTFTITPENVIGFDETIGALTAIGGGTATLTVATPFDGPTASLEVEVVAPDRLELHYWDPLRGRGEIITSGELVVGETLGLIAVAGSGDEEIDAHLSWSVGDPAVLSFEDNILTAIGAGEAVLLSAAAPYDSARGEAVTTGAAFTVSAPEWIRIETDGEDRSEITLLSGASVTTAIATDLASPYYDYSVSDGSILAFDETTGTLAALGTGTATLTVNAPFNGPGDALTVHVVVPTELHFEENGAKVTELNFLTGDDTTLTTVADVVTPYTYSIIPEGVIRFDEATGELTAVGGGTAILTAIPSVGSVRASLTINVTAATTVGFERDDKTVDELTLLPGEAVTLTTVADAPAHFTYRLTGDNVSFDEASGTLTALAAGEACLSVTTPFDGPSADLPIHVVVPAELYFSVNGEKQTALDLLAGDDITLTTVADVVTPYTYRISDESILAFDEVTGKLTALAKGTATLTAIPSVGDVRANLSVTVNAPSYLYFKDAEGKRIEALPLLAGDTATLALDTDVPTHYGYEITPEGVIAFDEATGTLTALAKGSATLTVKTPANGPTACLTVDVSAPEWLRFVDADGNELTTLTLYPGDTAALAIDTDVPTHYSFELSGNEGGAVAFDEKTLALSALKGGTVTLSAKTPAGGPTASLAITVIAPTRVWFEDADGNEITGDLTIREETVVTPAADVETPRLSCAVADETIVLYADGALTPLQAGSTTLTLTSHEGGPTAELAITVDAPTRVWFENSYGEKLTADNAPELPVNASMRIDPKADVEYTLEVSLDEGGVAEYTGGVLYGLKTGTATLTLKPAGLIGPVTTLEIAVVEEEYPLPSNAFDTEENVDGTLTITGCRMTDAYITIPAVINGKRVTRIADNAFTGHQTIQTIVVPEGVRTIGHCAFSNMPELLNVFLPSTVTDLPGDLIEGSEQAGLINDAPMIFGPFTCIYGSAARDSLTLIRYNGSESTVIVPDSFNEIPVMTLGARCFAGNRSIVKVTLPPTLEVFDLRAFADCDNLETID